MDVAAPPHGLRLAFLFDRPWRVLITGLSFVWFGLGGLLLGWVFAPLLTVLLRNPAARSSAMRSLVRRSFILFRWWGRAFGIFTVEVRGNLPAPGAPCVVIANHPTLIDAVLIMAELPRICCVVKRGVVANPFLGGVAEAADYIPNDNSEAFVGDAVQRLERGESILLFPEGSRSPLHGLRKFRRGAAQVALRAGCDIVPVLVTCEPSTLRKGQRWYEIPERRCHFLIQFMEPITTDLSEFAEEPLGAASRKLTEMLERYYLNCCADSAGKD